MNLQCIPKGLILSIPMVVVIFLTLTAKNISNDENNVLLYIWFVLFCLTLPWSLILFFIGLIAVFSNSALMQPLVWVCFVLAVIAAHINGCKIFQYFENKIKNNAKPESY